MTDPARAAPAASARPRAARACARVALALALALAPLAAGCLPRSEPLPIRWFGPDPAAGLAAGGGAAEPAGALGPLRARPAVAAAHLRERVVWRRSAVEVGFHEEVRWAEAPAAQVDRALAARLFERGPFVRSSSGDAPTLDVTLVALEERLAPREGLAALAVVLTDARGRALLERTFVARRAVAGDDAADAARAMTEALDAVVAEAAAAVGAGLAPAAAPPGSRGE